MTIFELIKSAKDEKDCLKKLLDVFESGGHCENCPAQYLCNNKSCTFAFDEWLSKNIMTKKIYCPLNRRNCPYYTEGSECICEKPEENCDDYKTFWEGFDDYEYTILESRSE